MKYVIMDECNHDIKVTYLGRNRWGVRCFVNGELNQEIQVGCREDIGVAAREMLRWEDKCGNISKFASAARKRLNKEFRRYKLESKVMRVK